MGTKKRTRKVFLRQCLKLKSEESVRAREDNPIVCKGVCGATAWCGNDIDKSNIARVERMNGKRNVE